MARLSLLSHSAVAMVAADFTEEGEEEASTVVEDFMEAGSEAEDFMEGADSVAAGSEAEGFTAEADSAAAELSVAGARFAGEPAFAEEPSVEAFVAIASDAVSVFAGEALDGEAGVGA